MKRSNWLIGVLLLFSLLVSCVLEDESNLTDNNPVVILEDEVEKGELENAVSDAIYYSSSIDVGVAAGDVYSQDYIDNYNDAIIDAQAVLDSNDVTQEEVDRAVTVLGKATTKLNNAVIEYENIPVEGLNGRQILVDGEPYYIKGVCWNPVPAGQSHPYYNGFSEFAESDAALMAAAGINTIRTYEPITDTAVLDHFHAKGIKVINTVYAYGGSSVLNVTNIVNSVKEHPAILMWAVGNEWNYNGFYYGLNNLDCLERINEVVRLIKEADNTRPVCSVYGSVPHQNVVDALPNVDVWGINYYSGLSFNDVFTEWESISDKPMFMAEYGADSYNALTEMEDEASQAEATTVLTQALMDNSSVTDINNVCSGGTIFSWADEWWKDSTGSVYHQDTGGFAPGGGPYPDSVFNEEFWGITDIDRNPKQAYYALQTLFVE